MYDILITVTRWEKWIIPDMFHFGWKTEAPTIAILICKKVVFIPQVKTWRNSQCWYDCWTPLSSMPEANLGLHSWTLMAFLPHLSLPMVISPHHINPISIPFSAPSLLISSVIWGSRTGDVPADEGQMLSMAITFIGDQRGYNAHARENLQGGRKKGWTMCR